MEDTEKKFTLLHKKSSVSGKLPTADDLQYGEIAVNYADGTETLSIRNSSNGITTFQSDKTTSFYETYDAAYEGFRTDYASAADGTQVFVRYLNSDGSVNSFIGIVHVYNNVRTFAVYPQQHINSFGWTGGDSVKYRLNGSSSTTEATETPVIIYDTLTSMYQMLYNRSSIESLDLSNLDTSSVKTMQTMLYGCSGLTSIDLSNFNTSNVTTMLAMFNGCSSLKTLDLSSFDTSELTTMYSMFYYCSGLTSIDLSSFDTSNVTSMRGTFDGCSSLETLDLSNFNTSNVTEMYNLFYNCTALTTLDLSNFDTSKVTSMTNMFYGCSDLTSIKVTNCSDTTISALISELANEKSSNLGTWVESDGYLVPQSETTEQ